MALVWADKEAAVGNEKYPKVTQTLKNALVGVIGEWEAEITVMSGGKKKFRLIMASCQKDPNRIKWCAGISVTCAMRYGESKSEKEPVFEVSAKFQTPEKEDHCREIDLILATMRTWVLEEEFPNARMSAYTKSLLAMDDLKDYLQEVNFPAIIWPNRN